MFELWKSTSEEYCRLLDTSEFSDTEIFVGEEPDTKVFKLHSLILKTRSPFFRTAFSSNWIKTENNIIKLNKPNISVKIFDILIKFIYSGVINLTEYDTRINVDVLIAADELCLNDLCVHIEEFLLDDEYSLKYNFILIQKTVNQLTQFTKLLQFYKINVQNDPSLILRANDFTTIQHETFLEFLTEYSQSLSPIEIWDKLIEWAIAHSHELPSDTGQWKSNEMTTFATIIKPFISHINFKEISISNFCQKVKPFKDIFDNDLYVEILEHYSFNEDAHSKFKMDIDSKIIDPVHAFLLCNLIKMTNQDHHSCTYDFKLLVRGSRDGFDIKNFHKKCNDKGPTITIAIVKNTNEILGGFNPLDWSPKYDSTNTKESFIFSLDKTNLSSLIFSKVVDENHAIYKIRGPDFGDKKSDLRLLEGSNKKGQCYKTSYEKLIRQVEGEFEIDDYEVFQIISSYDHNLDEVYNEYERWIDY
ncbi:hypothetical protein C1645_822669 [Glomus cerebriforme]|uniref:BTB/POZ domain-containing protein n=1 Tax=Glomus cerebriforme TaxID=658196 RepID=A0A397S1F5_9GLOM|nr:hypothetical protein C1645_794507 [Glomus cerebriforme]RIA90999.1 hypothetical protein C1645_822669 [Glomus cerebriforme]